MILSKFHCPLQTKRYLTFFRLSGIIACIRGGCSSVVERQIVDLVVVGSNPITHPFLRSCVSTETLPDRQRF